MRAAVYTRYGAPEVLHLAEVPRPTPKAKEVLVRVHASTVSAADFRCRSFTVPWVFWLPARLALGVVQPRQSILGAEFAGEVVEVGPEVTRFKVGDPVFASNLKFGGYGEFVSLKADGPIALKPNNLSYEEAAAVPLGACTALHFLNKAKIQAGQRVLIYGASGSVGTYGVQLAKHLGAEVTAVCSGANLELVRSLGAAEVVDYTQESVAARGERYDVILVAVDKVAFSECMKALKRGGVYLNVTAPVRSPAMIWANLTSGKRVFAAENTPETAESLNFLRGLIEAGQLRPVIDRRYPLEQIVEAHRYVDQGHKKGNVVIAVA